MEPANVSELNVHLALNRKSKKQLDHSCASLALKLEVIIGGPWFCVPGLEFQFTRLCSRVLSTFCLCSVFYCFSCICLLSIFSSWCFSWSLLFFLSVSKLSVLSSVCFCLPASCFALPVPFITGFVSAMSQLQSLESSIWVQTAAATRPITPASQHLSETRPGSYEGFYLNISIITGI